MEDFCCKVRADFTTDYMACSQYIDWNVNKIQQASTDGFIVQEVLLGQMIDGDVHEAHYYEAWYVKNGECIKEKNQVSHDLFCIGHPMDTSDAMIISIGHFGKVSFIPFVYWVEYPSELFETVNRWPTNVVREANGLKSIYYTEKIEKEFQKINRLKRTPFIHEWDFRDEKLIYETVLKYCKTMYHLESKIDRSNFQMFINDAFPEGVYPDVKRRIIEEWGKLKA